MLSDIPIEIGITQESAQMISWQKFSELQILSVDGINSKLFAKIK
jgi:hypothetical protein